MSLWADPSMLAARDEFRSQPQLMEEARDTETSDGRPGPEDRSPAEPHPASPGPPSLRLILLREMLAVFRAVTVEALLQLGPSLSVVGRVLGHPALHEPAEPFCRSLLFFGMLRLSVHGTRTSRRRDQRITSPPRRSSPIFYSVSGGSSPYPELGGPTVSGTQHLPDTVASEQQ